MISERRRCRAPLKIGESDAGVRAPTSGVEEGYEAESSKLDLVCKDREWFEEGSSKQKRRCC